MIKICTAQTELPDSTAAGEDIGSQVREQFGARVPDVIIVFSSSIYKYSALLHGIQRVCAPRQMIGSSSAGEFTSPAARVGSVSALAIASDEMKFNLGIGRELRQNRTTAAKQIISSFRGINDPDFSFRVALVMADALAGYTDELIEQMTMMTLGAYQFIGGGAGDDAQFQRTMVFAGTEVVPNAAVALEILSNKPIGIGVRHGWEPSSPALQVTESEGMRVVSLDGIPACEAFKKHAHQTKQTFNLQDPVPFFLHNVLGIQTGGNYKLRVPLTVNYDGSVNCASDIKKGASVHNMRVKESSAADAMAIALGQMGAHKPAGALFFDCVATRLRLGKEFDGELAAVGNALKEVPFAGCNTYGQIVRAKGQFSGFHNCTAVACVFPE